MHFNIDGFTLFSVLYHQTHARWWTRCICVSSTKLFLQTTLQVCIRGLVKVFMSNAPCTITDSSLTLISVEGSTDSGNSIYKAMGRPTLIFL